MVELLTAAAFLACYWQFGGGLSAVKYCAFSFFLLGLVFTDAEWKLLPDALTFPGLAIGLAISLVVPVNDLASRLLPWLGMIGTGAPPWTWHWRLASLAQSVLGAIVGAAFIYGAGMLYLRMRPDLAKRGKDVMGLGDVKLMAMSSRCLPPPSSGRFGVLWWLPSSGSNGCNAGGYATNRPIGHGGLP